MFRGEVFPIGLRYRNLAVILFHLFDLTTVFVCCSFVANGAKRFPIKMASAFFAQIIGPVLLAVLASAANFQRARKRQRRMSELHDYEAYFGELEEAVAEVSPAVAAAVQDGHCSPTDRSVHPRSLRIWRPGPTIGGLVFPEVDSLGTRHGSMRWLTRITATKSGGEAHACIASRKCHTTPYRTLVLNTFAGMCTGTGSGCQKQRSHTLPTPSLHIRRWPGTAALGISPSRSNWRLV